jgi:hypothetical protein
MKEIWVRLGQTLYRICDASQGRKPRGAGESFPVCSAASWHPGGNLEETPLHLQGSESQAGCQADGPKAPSPEPPLTQIQACPSKLTCGIGEVNQDVLQ